jgi:hypothetical protein
MKRATTLFLAVAAMSAAAQTKISKSIPVRAGQTLNMHFDYPELIKVTSWDKNEISIQGEVMINGGENDDAFRLNLNDMGSSISVRNEIVDMKKLPERVTVEVEGRKMTFRSKAEWNRYREEHGVTSRWVNNGVDMEIVLEIKVPRNMDTRIVSVYGIVEVREFAGPLTVEATYGGVDVSFSETNMGELVAETNYGHIYSNLDFKPDQKNSREEDFHLYVAATLGKGPRCRLESQYGNVYLRKATSK